MPIYLNGVNIALHSFGSVQYEWVELYNHDLGEKSADLEINIGH